MSKTVIRDESPMQRILEYTPVKFDLGVTAPAKNYQDIQKTRENDFRMADVLLNQTGLSKIEAHAREESVELRALEKLKEIQEGAYQEAYNLGLEEGKKEAFNKASEEIDQRVAQFGHLLTAIEHLKSELIKQNEAHIIKLVLHVAAKIAQVEVKVNNQCLVEILRSAIEGAQLDEEITVQIASQQFEFLEKLKAETGRQYDFLKKVKLVPMENIGSGGCIIETNYGVIDARVEERVGKLWETMADSMFKVKDQVGAA